MSDVRRLAWTSAVLLALSSCAAERQAEPRAPERPRASAPPAGDCPPLSIELPELDDSGESVAVPPIEDFSRREQLGELYEKLAAITRGRQKEPIRIGFWGDSNMTRDFISGELRRVLQARFGDAGHGYVAVGKPWGWYLHMDVEHGADDGWTAYNLSTSQVGDRLYGFAGIAAQNTRPRAKAWISTAPAGSPVGERASLVEVLYLRHPKHGSFKVRIDREPPQLIDANAPSVSAGIWRRELPDTPHRVGLEASDDAASPVRLLGVVLERRAPGVVVDCLGIGGVNMQLFARGNEQLLRDTLRMRRYDLLLLLTGATEPDSQKHDDAARDFITSVQRALPETPLMMMSPPDLSGGTIKHPTRVPRMNQIQKRKLALAREKGLLYWDFRGAMGGEQSIVRFAERKLAWTDFIHLSETGGRLMGRRFAYALLRDFQRWLEAHSDAGCK